MQGKGGERKKAVDRRERGDHMEEPTCENHPTSMHRCVISHTASFKTNPVLCRHLQKPSDFIQHFFIQLFSPHNSKFYLFRVSRPMFIDVESL